MARTLRFALLMFVALTLGACGPIVTLWPGRIMAMTPEDLLRRVRAVAEDGRLLDQPFVERALGVRFGAVRPPSPLAPIERYPLTWIDAPEPLQRPFADRVRPLSGQPPFERLFLTLPDGGPCVTFRHARRALGEGFTIPAVVPSAGSGASSGSEATPLSADCRVRDARAAFLTLSWQGGSCVVVIILTTRIS